MYEVSHVMRKSILLYVRVLQQILIFLVKVLGQDIEETDHVTHLIRAPYDLSFEKEFNSFQNLFSNYLFDANRLKINASQSE